MRFDRASARHHSTSGKVSVSIAATFIGPADLDQIADERIARADRRPVEATHAGRNRVILRRR
ncbi:MAG: hypothetical protein QOE66_9 [Chloroflexota bacterium]|nr:hypothetical protein [Chloroflexota bacterium]